MSTPLRSLLLTERYSLRLYAAPKRCKHFFEVMNMIDLLAFLPFYLELIILIAVPADFKYRNNIETIVLVSR